MSPHPVEWLSAFLDDELPDAERRGVEAHLAACPSCARHLRELAAVDALARGLPPAGAPDGYLEALPGRVRQRIRADRPASTRAPWVWPLAAGLALAVLAPLVLRQGPFRRPPAEEGRAAQAVTPPPAATPGPTAGRAAEAQAGPTVVGDLEADQDALARAGARPRRRAATPTDERRRILSGGAEDAPRRAPAAAPTPKPAPPLAARGNQAAGAMVLRDEVVAPAEEMKQDEVQVQERRRAESGVASDSSFRSIAALPLSTAAEARRARQAWLRFVADHPRGERLDEARVRLVEASVAAFRASGDPADRAVAEREAGAYLSSPAALQAARVKAALRRLDDPH